MEAFKIMEAIASHPATKDGDYITVSPTLFEAMEDATRKEMESVAHSLGPNFKYTVATEPRKINSIYLNGKTLHIIKQ